VATAVASCFSNIGSPRFDPQSAHSCIASASVYCATETLCKTDLPAPTNVLGDAGGFEDGQLWPLSSSGGADTALSATIDDSGSDLVHSGRHALKAVFTNANGASRTYVKTVQLEPGATYELSLWVRSSNAQAHTVARVQITGGGPSLLWDTTTQNKPVGEWFRSATTFTPLSSVVTVFFSVYGNLGQAANTFYVDDISILKVA